jgi:hypothetical protein
MRITHMRLKNRYFLSDYQNILIKGERIDAFCYGLSCNRCIPSSIAGENRDPVIRAWRASLAR